MKRGMACLGMILALVLLLGTAGAGMAEEKEYINGIDPNFPPYAYVNKNGQPDGFDVKALDWIAKEMGFKVRHQPTDWDGIIPALKAKKIDMIASGMSVTEKRKEQVNFTDFYKEIVVVLLAGNDCSRTVEQILAEGNLVCVQRGTTEASWMKDNLLKQGAKFELREYDSSPAAVADILNGRIVAAAMDDVTALDAVKKKPVKIVGPLGMEEEYFAYAVRKEDTQLLKTLNDGLKRLMASPYWDELKQQYDVQ